MPNNSGGFRNIGVAGVGLIGGSFAKTFAANGINVYGYDINRVVLEQVALSNVFKGVTDEISVFLRFPMDLIYISLPVHASLLFIKTLGEHGVKTPVTDSGSSKVSVMKTAFEEGLNFCGGHPIKGKETSGFENSENDLFKNAKHILTPGKDLALAENLKKLHSAIGMKVSFMDPETHDNIFALVSHLPHLASFCLMDTVSEGCEEAFSFAGGGFRDFTRIAASDPTMWADIFNDNKDCLLKNITAFEKSIIKWKKLIETGNYKELKQNIETVSNIRRQL